MRDFNDKFPSVYSTFAEYRQCLTLYVYLSRDTLSGDGKGRKGERRRSKATRAARRERAAACRKKGLLARSQKGGNAYCVQTFLLLRGDIITAFRRTTSLTVRVLKHKFAQSCSSSSELCGLKMTYLCGSETCRLDSDSTWHLVCEKYINMCN